MSEGFKLAEEEAGVICIQCSYPEILLSTEDGSGFEWITDDGAPQTEEEAFLAGWADTEFGFLCPHCAGKAAARRAQEEAEGVVSGADGLVAAIERLLPQEQE